MADEEAETRNQPALVAVARHCRRFPASAVSVRMGVKPQMETTPFDARIERRRVEAHRAAHGIAEQSRSAADRPGCPFAGRRWRRARLPPSGPSATSADSDRRTARFRSCGCRSRSDRKPARRSRPGPARGSDADRCGRPTCSRADSCSRAARSRSAAWRRRGVFGGIVEIASDVEAEAEAARSSLALLRLEPAERIAAALDHPIRPDRA